MQWWYAQKIKRCNSDRPICFPSITAQVYLLHDRNEYSAFSYTVEFSICCISKRKMRAPARSQDKETLFSIVGPVNFNKKKIYIRINVSKVPNHPQRASNATLENGRQFCVFRFFRENGFNFTTKKCGLKWYSFPHHSVLKCGIP